MFWGKEQGAREIAVPHRVKGVTLEEAERVGSLLRDARHRRRLTQKDVAAAIGIEASHLSMCERGSDGAGNLKFLSLPAFVRFCKAVNLPATLVLQDYEEGVVDGINTMIEELGEQEFRWIGTLTREEVKLASVRAHEAVDALRFRRSRH